MKFVRSITPVLILFLTLSCAMKQNIALEKDGSGELDFSVNLAPYLGEVIDQISLLMEGEAPDPEKGFFDLPEIRKGFAENKDVDLNRLTSPDRLSLEGSMRFNSIESIISNMEENSAGKDMIRFSAAGGISTLELEITRENIRSVINENEAFQNPLVENFGPGATEGLSKEDYLAMMEFAMGRESRQGILDSRLIIDVRVNGEVTEQTGGTLQSDSTVRFALPLLDLLILDSPLRYSLSYR